jgi:hypothetical protein
MKKQQLQDNDGKKLGAALTVKLKANSNNYTKTQRRRVENNYKSEAQRLSESETQNIESETVTSTKTRSETQNIKGETVNAKTSRHLAASTIPFPNPSPTSPVIKSEPKDVLYPKSCFYYNICDWPDPEHNYVCDDYSLPNSAGCCSVAWANWDIPSLGSAASGLSCAWHCDLQESYHAYSSSSFMCFCTKCAKDATEMVER